MELTESIEEMLVVECPMIHMFYYESFMGENRRYRFRGFTWLYRGIQNSHSICSKYIIRYDAEFYWT